MSSKNDDRFVYCLLISLFVFASLGVGFVPLTTFLSITVAIYWYFVKYRHNKKRDDAPYCEEQRQAYMDEALITTVENGGTIEEAKLAAEAIGKLYDKKKGR